MRWVLLPGLDGTSQMYLPLMAVILPHVEPIVVAFPTDRPLSYAALLPLVIRELPVSEPYILVAESFSGPLAIEVASAGPAQLKGLVLCASFARCPISPMSARLVEWSRHLIFRWPLPAWAVRRYLVGNDAPVELVAQFQIALGLLHPAVIAARMKNVLEVDVTRALSAVSVPMLYLRATNDKLVGQRSLDLMLHCQKDIRVAEINSPHLILQRRPKEAVAAIEQFMRDTGIAEHR